MKQTNGWWHPDGDTSCVGRPDANRDYQETRYHNYYINQIEKHLTSYETAIDVGANIGFMTIPLAQRFKQVHAFEPNPRVYDALTANAQSADLINKLDCHNVALSNTTENGKLYFRKGVNKSTVGKIYTGDKDKSNMVSISIIQLDDLNIQNVDLLKIDVEGFEKQVIEGGLKTIERDKPIICLEMNDDDMEEYMLGIGYELVQRHALKEGIFKSNC